MTARSATPCCAAYVDGRGYGAIQQRGRRPPDGRDHRPAGVRAMPRPGLV